jgi:hypothetical protein
VDGAASAGGARRGRAVGHRKPGRPRTAGLAGVLAPQRADHAPLWVQRCVLQLAEHTAAASRTFAYCAFGAKHQKYTTVMHDLGWVELEPLDDRLCEHGNEAHAEQLRGRLESGESRAGRAAAYPDELK